MAIQLKTHVAPTSSLLRLPFKFIARLCERSSQCRNLLRSIHFKGKSVAVNFIDLNSFPEQTLLADCDGIRYELELQDEIQRMIYFNYYERQSLKRVLTLIREGSTCFDVGANVGFYALNFARAVGRTGKVFAFEANSSVAEKLKRNIALNAFEPIIEVAEWAVSDKVGESVFSMTSDQNSGWGHLGEDSRFKHTIVKTNTIDNFFEEKGLEHIDLMKVDIEGAEDQLIEGAVRVLSEKRIKHIYMEFCKMHCDEVKHRLNHLGQFGYLPDDGDRATLQKMMRDEVYSSELVQNFLFHAA
ncbi:MAG: FkbM family methyltransferase [Chloroherpetonaceae bacterium]